MMHRRLTTAGIEVAPHYHQLLVRAVCYVFIILRIKRSLHVRGGTKGGRKEGRNEGTKGK